MIPQTVDEFKQQVLESKRCYLPVRKCSICDCPIGYNVLYDYTLMWNGTCNCTSMPYEENRSWEDAYQTIARQPTLEIQQAVWDTMMGRMSPT